MMGEAPPADRKDLMMAQLTFAEQEHDLKKCRTRRELFLEKMDKLMPWESLEAETAPFDPKAGRGRWG